jgi:hypothetical protein
MILILNSSPIIYIHIQPDFAYQTCSTPLSQSGRCRFVQHCARQEIIATLNAFVSYACPIGSEWVFVITCHVYFLFFYVEEFQVNFSPISHVTWHQGSGQNCLLKEESDVWFNSLFVWRQLYGSVLSRQYPANRSSNSASTSTSPYTRSYYPSAHYDRSSNYESPYCNHSRSSADCCHTQER